ncbi:hypothetical protein EDD22DRAFT_955758 [Suillus occidentalis]|nr:hypothetical protein EDD22DRAFT_955758 [Suillus occidentalis]
MPAIYVLTATPEAVATVTRGVLQSFLNYTGDGAELNSPQCTYLELRTTPCMTVHMTQEWYLTVVLDGIEMYPATQATLIVSVDRRMSDLDLEECISLAIKMKNRGRRVHLSRAKSAGLGLTMHTAESTKNTTFSSTPQ